MGLANPTLELEPGDRVVTPSGEVAVVLGPDREGGYELRYTGALNKQHATLSLPPQLLRRVEEGKPFPSPVVRKVWT